MWLMSWGEGGVVVEDEGERTWEEDMEIVYSGGMITGVALLSTF